MAKKYSLTCVSGYWQIINKHGNSFDNWFHNTLKINCPYVFFSNKETIEIIKKYRGNIPTYYIECNIEDFTTYKYRNQMITDPVHCPSIELNLIWNEKIFLIKKAFEINPFSSDFFCWVDAGICIYRNNPPPTISFPNINTLKKMPKNRFIYSSSHNTVYNSNNFIKGQYHLHHHVSGTTFMLHKNIINKFVKLYRKYLSLIDKDDIWSDQVLLTHIYKDNKDLFYKLSDGYGTLISELFNPPKDSMNNMSNKSNMTNKSNGQINIEYQGLFGNHLFQYFSARIYAEKNKLNLISNFPNIINTINIDVKLLPNKNFGENPDNMSDITITDNDYNEKHDNIGFKGIGNYKWTGYHQFEKYYYKNITKILKWIDLKKTKRKQYACIHIRIGDFLSPTRSMIINREYYKYCINKYCKNYDKIMIIKQHSDNEFEKEYINDLTKYIKSLGKKVIYKNNNMLKDFELLYNANLIITSNSTFCFWGSFLSNAKVIEFPLTDYLILPGNIVQKFVTETFHSNFYKRKHNKKSIINTGYSNKMIDYFDDKVWDDKSFINQLVGDNGVYVINLEQDTKKSEFMKTQLDNNKISYTRVNGTHGIKEPLEELNKYYNVGYDRTKISDYTFGQAGCATSHIKLWNSLKEKLINKDTWALILEDDALLMGDTNMYLKEAWQILSNDFKENGIVYLQWCYPNNLSKLLHKSEYVSIIKGSGFHGTTAYMINNNGLKRLLNIPVPFTNHVDYTILCNTVASQGAYGIKFKNIKSNPFINNLKDEYKKKIIYSKKILNDGIINGLSNINLIESNINTHIKSNNNNNFMDYIINKNIIRI